MSWSAEATIVPGEDTYSSFEGVKPLGQEGKHVEEAFNAALYAVDAIMSTEVIGDDSKSIRVVLGGHANPDHEPAEGFANDCLTINLYQVKED